MLKKKLESKIVNFISTEIEWVPLNNVEVSKDKIEITTEFLETSITLSDSVVVCSFVRQFMLNIFDILFYLLIYYDLIP